MDLAHGETLAGYVIEGVLGQGGMGTVYRARHPRLPRSVALKLLNADVADDPELRARFEREAHVVATLDHPGIVAIQDRGVENGRPWLAMQFVEGVDANRIDARTMRADRAVRIIAEVAAALDYAHSRGVLHRDVKPANILLTTEQAGRVERAVLTDFGIARLLTSDTRLTSTGSFTATLAYASPEQLSGGDVDHRSDQYSLACTLYALLAGRAPFAAPDPGQVVAGHLTRPVPPLGRADVPARLDAVIARATAKNPAERFAGAGEFAAAATHAITGGPAAAWPPAPSSAPPTVVFDHRASLPSARNQDAAPGLDGSPWPAACAVAFGFFVVLLAHYFVGVSSPLIVRDLGVDLDDLHWLNTVYVLCAATPMVAAGRLGDRFGPKTVYLTGLAVFTAGSGLVVLAPGFRTMVLAQAVQGLGVALIVPQIVAVIVRTFAADRRGAAFGLWAGAGAVTALAFPAMNYLSWRSSALLVVPLCVVAIGLAAALLPNLPRLPSERHPLGVLLSTAGVLLVVVGLGYALSTDPMIRAVLVTAGLALFGLFLWLQTRQVEDPLVPPVALRDRNWWVATAATVVMATATGALLTMVSLTMLHVSRLGIGLALIPATIVTVVFAPIMGYAADRTRPAVIPVLGFGLSAICAVGVMVTAQAGASDRLTAVLGGAIVAVLGFATACVLGPLAATATRSLPPRRAGVVAGIYATAFQIGTVATPTVLLELLSLTGDIDLRADLSAAAKVIVVIQTVLALAVAVLMRSGATPPDHPTQRFPATY